MMTKEEYKKTLIRIWDSVRDKDFKGTDFCYGVKCSIDCPIKSFCGNKAINYYDMIEFVEKWGKEHPAETNGSRFLKNYPKAEIYGFDSNDDGFVNVKFPIAWWESEVDDAINNQHS